MFTLTNAHNAQENPFMMHALPTSTTHTVEGKCGKLLSEGKCGEKRLSEGKCGEKLFLEGKCGEKKLSEGKCGEKLFSEGKCGEKH